MRGGLYPSASLFMTSKERYNLCMNHASLDSESLDRVSWTTISYKIFETNSSFHEK